MTSQSQYSRNLFLPIMKKITDIFSNCIRSGTFLEILKKPEVKSVLKKGTT